MLLSVLVIQCLFIFCRIISAQVPDPYGRVVISSSPNDTEEVYSFNENYKSSLEIPVFLLLVNATTGEILPDPPQNPVEVTCENSPDQYGYTQTTFIPNMITETGTVGFSVTEPGRPVDLRCWGEDTAAFTKELSLSEPVVFQVRPAGQVSITQPVVLVPNEHDINNMKGTFVVELSEEAEFYSVTVNCNQTKNTGLRLNFEESTVPVGSRKTSVGYSVKARGDPVDVVCRGQSNTTKDGQFQAGNSQGEGARFMLASGSAVLVPEKSELKTTQINVTLILDSIPTTDVIFVCYLRMATSSQHAKELAQNPICQLPNGVVPTETPPIDNFTDIVDFTTDVPSAAPSPAPTLPPDVAPRWQILNSILLFQANLDLFRSLRINRTQDVAAPTAELFVVTCCAPEPINTSPKYINMSTSLAVASYLTPSWSINWTDATVPSDSEKETELINPAFVEVSPCSCDLGEDACNVDCCCDKDCQDDDILLFTCLPGLFGGDSSAPPGYMCDAPYIQQPDWFSLMCVQFNNSAFLGYFINPEAALRDTSSYNSKAAQYRSPYSFLRNAIELPAESAYKDGLSVRTGLPMNQQEEEGNYIGPNYRLALPKRTLGGACVLGSPVRFLRDSSDECVWTMEASLCSGRSQLSALVYAQADQWVGVKGPLVLGTMGVGAAAVTNVNYLCVNTTAPYVMSADMYQDVVRPGQSYLFDFRLPADGQCSFDPTSGAYVCPNQTASGLGAGAGAGAARCGFDDGFTKPPPPTYDRSAALCSYAVVGVLYNFTWRGTDVVSLNATIVLGDVAMKTAGLEGIRGDNATVLTQTFQVVFYHQMDNITVNYVDIANDNYVRINRTDQYKRSGNPGYEWTKPVISGVAVYESNNTFVSDQFKYVDANVTNRLSLWKPGVDGLCLNAGREDVQFGVDALGTCLLKMGMAELQDCAELRRLILNRQDSLMPSTLISLGGDPDYNNLEIDWAPVFRQDIKYILGPGDLPVTVDQTKPTTTVMPVTVPPNQTLSDGFDQVSGRCTHIPSHVTVNVLYAKVGESDAIPLWQIVGAKISYTLTTWQLFCVGPGGTACYTNASWVQQMTSDNGTRQAFQLSSSVRFTEVPHTDPKPKTLYEERTEPRVWKCRQDACLEEMFYPFLKINPGDSYQYTTSLGLICLVLLFAMFLVSRPVSRWDYIHGEL